MALSDSCRLTTKEIASVQRELNVIGRINRSRYDLLLNTFEEKMKLLEQKQNHMNEYIKSTTTFLQKILRDLDLSRDVLDLNNGIYLPVDHGRTAATAQVPNPNYDCKDLCEGFVDVDDYEDYDYDDDQCDGVGNSLQKSEPDPQKLPGSEDDFPEQEVPIVLEPEPKPDLQPLPVLKISEVGQGKEDAILGYEYTALKMKNLSPSSPSSFQIGISNSSSPAQPFRFESEMLIAEIGRESKVDVEDRGHGQGENEDSKEENKLRTFKFMNAFATFEHVRLPWQKQLVRFSTEQIRRSSRGHPNAILMEGFFDFEIYGKTIPLRMDFLHLRSPSPGSVSFSICFPNREGEKQNFEDDYYGNYDVKLDILDHNGTPVITKGFQVLAGSGSCDLETESASIHMGCDGITFSNQIFLTPDQLLVLNDKCLLIKRRRPHFFILFQAQIQFSLRMSSEGGKL